MLFLPTISIVIPTLNSGKTLEECLASIKNQDYPQGKIEIIIADGGSNDGTLNIAKKFGANIVQNSLKTGESGKAVGLRAAKNNFIAFIDSDNILPHPDWMKIMIKPLNFKDIVGSEPLEYLYRKQDKFITRYSALMGMNDPLCLFLGNYDRKNVITGKWTGLPVTFTDQGSWLLVILKKNNIPTIGANGTIIRSSFFKGKKKKKYLFDVDILADEALKKDLKFAKVKIGIIHTFCESSIQKFWRKQKRRVQDYMLYKKMGIRKYDWQQNKFGIILFVFACLSVFPLIIQCLIGYFKKPDAAWFFHPLACWITLIVYSYSYVIYSLGFVSVTDRTNWRQ